jgi:hypothetical protein
MVTVTVPVSVNAPATVIKGAGGVAPPSIRFKFAAPNVRLLIGSVALDPLGTTRSVAPSATVNAPAPMLAEVVVKVPPRTEVVPV